jgi:Holliday junction resolvase-like predicted endonuclease
MVEADIENEVVAWCKANGGEALKLKLEGQRGWPDRTILMPGGVVVFVELKHKAKPSFQQLRWLARLEELGFTAGICHSLDDVKGLLNA